MPYDIYTETYKEQIIDTEDRLTGNTPIVHATDIKRVPQFFPAILRDESEFLRNTKSVPQGASFYLTFVAQVLSLFAFFSSYQLAETRKRPAGVLDISP